MTAVVVAATLLVFAALAWASVSSKSPTYDEPLHVIAGWLQVHEGDFRVDPEDPPLWKYWAALMSRRDDVKADLKLPPGTPIPQTTGATPVQVDPREKLALPLRYRLVAEDIYHEWPFTAEVLYPCGRSLPAESNQCPDTDSLVARMRLMMLIFAVGGGVVLAMWGWQLGGSATAITATLLYCLDPNILAHGPLVKNDVPLMIISAALFWAVWRAGRKLTILNALAICLLCAAAVTTKFSALLLGPIVAVLLILRALLPTPWPTFWRTLERRAERIVAVTCVLISAVIISYVGIWAAYGFRFQPTNDPAIELNLGRMSVYTAMAEMSMKLGRPPNDAEIAAWRPSLMTQAILHLDAMQALPQAWLDGLLYTYQSALMRQTYLLGDYSMTGWWYYFPVAMFVKAPLSMLVACVGAIVVLVLAMRALGWRATAGTWTAACLFIPPALFLASAMRSNLNLGLRHILPIYPFIYLGIALAVSEAWRRRRGVTKWIAGVLAIALAVETLSAFPDYLAFFNAAAGGKRGGLKILGDSNLDWGQDLKLLAQWQQERQRSHPNENLYLVYFGLADPWAYGIKYTNFPGGYAFGPKWEKRFDPGIIAISATALQGIYTADLIDEATREQYAQLRRSEPIEVLGGTIYLYRWPPAPRTTTPPATRK
jgi:4-amino-4-deoxy-L-arabinose transferase-like glycosyltransferase